MSPACRMHASIALLWCRSSPEHQHTSYEVHCLCRLFKGLTPLWGRQIPYTMMKFGEHLCALSLSSLHLLAQS